MTTERTSLQVNTLVGREVSRLTRDHRRHLIKVTTLIKEDVKVRV